MAYQPRAPDSNEDDSSHRLYNPYQDLQLPVQAAYKLPTSPEFLFPEESIRKRRSFSDNLTYYTGMGYLSGSLAGGAKGFVSGVKFIEPSDTMKLKINRILNCSGHVGRQIGNRCGVIGLLYGGLKSLMLNYRDTDDAINSIVAGLGTGVLYKAAAGPRPAAVAGALGGALVWITMAGKQALKRYVPI